MKIFISWSKDKSKEIAKETQSALKKLGFKYVFISGDIVPGQNVQNTIHEKLAECDTLIMCLTNENKLSPWLLYETGYAVGCNKTVIPIHFDEDKNSHSWINNPIQPIKEIKFGVHDFGEELFKALLIERNDANNNEVAVYIETVKKIQEKHRLIAPECEDFVDRLMHNDAFIMENPIFHNKSAFFLTGFESFDLYKAITDSFLYTGKYLWIYGRKNMKLFGGNYVKLFKFLKEKALANDLMDGIDFRCLFLDPNSDEVTRAHPQQKIFKTELEVTILRAQDVIGDNMRFAKCFRMYSNKREEIIIRLDNCIICSHPTFDANGRPQLLTNSSFEVFSTYSDKGKECIKKYEAVWTAALPMQLP